MLVVAPVGVKLKLPSVEVNHANERVVVGEIPPDTLVPSAKAVPSQTAVLGAPVIETVGWLRTLKVTVFDVAGSKHPGT